MPRCSCIINGLVSAPPSGLRDVIGAAPPSLGIAIRILMLVREHWVAIAELWREASKQALRDLADRDGRMG